METYLFSSIKIKVNLLWKTGTMSVNHRNNCPKLYNNSGNWIGLICSHVSLFHSKQDNNTTKVQMVTKIESKWEYFSEKKGQ